MIAVTSSMMTAVDYDDRTSNLRIRFTDGDWYTYLNVPHAIYDALLAASSHGRFFHARIRNRFRYRRG